MWRFILLLCFPLIGYFNDLHAQSKALFDHEWLFHPGYTLPGGARVVIGHPHQPPVSKFKSFQIRNATPEYRGRQPTDIIHELLDKPLSLPVSLELSIVHHVNKPAAMALILKGHDRSSKLLGYHSKSDRHPANLEFLSLDEELAKVVSNNAFQKYWHHYVVQLDTKEIEIHHNGVQISRRAVSLPEEINNFDIAAYLAHEPCMQLGNLLKKLSIKAGRMRDEEIELVFSQFQQEIENGAFYAEQLYFTAGPYLHFGARENINMVWEINKPARATIEYGTEIPLQHQIELKHTNQKSGNTSAPFIFETTVTDLRPGTSYFYNIKLTGLDGQEKESGLLTFKTAVDDNASFMFALIGDTETRPHINDRIANLIWKERPDFVVHLGDLTDGGMADAKWQWNLEYFEGMRALHQRIPVFPVPGNGEGDLYWYKKYHRLPGNEAYYYFQYGNADFYMLNSNERKHDFEQGGTQYQWLDSALATSSGTWKFIALHHAPYSADENDYGNTYQGQSNLGDPHVQQLIPLFEKHEVDMVMFGHLHSYSRIGPVRGKYYDELNGVRYIQAGGAGGNLEDFAPNKVWFSQKTYAGHHYCIININDDELILKTYDLDGALIDYMKVEK